MKKWIVFFALTASISTASAGFSDVSTSHPYYNSIMRLSDEGVVNGYADGNFLPGKVINRAEFLKIAVLAKEGDGFESSSDLQCFTDVSPGDWFSAYVCTAEENGWVKGYGGGEFRPGSPISFGEAFTMLQNIFELDSSGYVEGDWYYRPMKYFSMNDLIPENIEQSVDFQVNRGEMVEMIARTLLHLEKLDGGEAHVVSDPFESYRMDVYRMVNEERKNAGIVELKYNMQLENAAGEHAEAMMNEGFFAHTNPNSGSTVFDRCKHYLYDQRDIGENIAEGQESPEAVMESWMNSPPHKKNILHDGFREIGIGIAETPDGDIYWVQVFGTQCEERDDMIGCTTRSDFQERNPGEYASSFHW